MCVFVGRGITEVGGNIMKNPTIILALLLLPILVQFRLSSQVYFSLL